MNIDKDLLHDKKVVIVHDWLTVYGGAERVLDSILQIFPKADIVTMVCNYSCSIRFENSKIITSQQWLLKTFPKQYRHFLPFMPRWIEQFDLSEYDIVISSSHAVAKGVICHPHQKHLSYVYSPMRYAWDLQFEHFRRGDFGGYLKAWLIKRWLHSMRIWDAASFLRPDKLVATSSFISKRIKHVCNRRSSVIYPPVQSPDFSKAESDLITFLEGQDYYLVISRLVPYKSIDKIVRAFKDLTKQKLIVIGEGPLKSELKRVATDNVQITGFLPESDKLAYLLNAKAFIHMAVEDFGIAPLEAQFAGVPVIGYSKGALSETIQDLATSDKPSGVLFHRQSEESLIDAIKRFELQTDITEQNCKENAQKFNNERFVKEFKQAVWEMLEND